MKRFWRVSAILVSRPRSCNELGPPVVEQNARHANGHARLAASPLPRACIALTKSEEKERLLAVYYYDIFGFIQFTVFLPHAVCSLQSAVCGLRSAICGLRSAVCGLRSAVCGLRSAVCSLQMSYTVGLFVDVVFCQEPVSVLKTSSYHPQTLFL